MLIPKMYRPSRVSDVIETVRSNPLALVATNGVQTPFATHAPVIIQRLVAPPGEEESLVGGSLLGHMNRANDHWQALQERGNVLIVFQGPHSYISPVAYEQRPAAPTWNFITVHVRGRVEPIAAGAATLDVLTATVRALEKVAGTAWDMTDSLGYFRNIQPRVGAFRVHVETVEAMFKLSQEHPAEVRRSIRDYLSAHDCGMGREVSAAMWSADEPDRPSQAAGVGEPAGEQLRR